MSRKHVIQIFITPNLPFTHSFHPKLMREHGQKSDIMHSPGDREEDRAGNLFLRGQVEAEIVLSSFLILQVTKLRFPGWLLCSALSEK